jgi:hypothetical protein
MHLLADEMADIDAIVDVELRKDIVLPCDGVDFRSDLGIGKGCCHGVGLSEMAFNLDEEGLHRYFPLGVLGSVALRR